ncbi:hypothetical protein F5Y07DRAFT_403049 [Xylaria sp. FL0933]|nr:hypothetical protein F5Y07DRAFT_403049 [Xylaria sp. FL0933]
MHHMPVKHMPVKKEWHNWNTSGSPPWTAPEVETPQSKDGGIPGMQAAILTILILAASLVILRMYYHIFRGRRRLMSDDYFLIAALLCLVGNGVAMWEWVPQKYEPNVTTTASARMVLAGSLMGLFNSFALGFSKTSLGITFGRLMAGWWRSSIGLSLFVIDIMFVVQAWSYWVADCGGPAEPYRVQTSIEQGCITFKGITAFRITVQVLSCALDGWFMVLPWKIVRPLKLKKFEKIGLLIAMSFGFASLGCGMARLVVLARLAKQSYDHQPFYSVGGFLFNYLEPGLTIVAACMPITRKLFMDAVKWKKSNSIAKRVSRRRKKQAVPAVLPVNESPGSSTFKHNSDTTLVAPSNSTMPTPPSSLKNCCTCDRPVVSKKLYQLPRWA